MAAPSNSTAGRRPPALIAVFVVPVIVAVALSTFAWSAAELEPRDLPLGLAGPAEANRPVEQQLAARGDAFDLDSYEDEAAARDAIEDRDIYGAVVVSPGGRTLLTASAASPLVAGLLDEPRAASPAPAVGTYGQTQARVRLVEGAGGNLLRSTAFFDGAGAAGHLTVLLVGAAVGLGAILVAARRHAGELA
jgi:hypothetical protein